MGTPLKKEPSIGNFLKRHHEICQAAFVVAHTESLSVWHELEGEGRLARLDEARHWPPPPPRLDATLGARLAAEPWRRHTPA